MRRQALVSVSPAARPSPCGAGERVEWVAAGLPLGIRNWEGGRPCSRAGSASSCLPGQHQPRPAKSLLEVN